MIEADDGALCAPIWKSPKEFFASWSFLSATTLSRLYSASNSSYEEKPSIRQNAEQFMSNRVKRFVYHFPTPFKLTGMDEICAAGDYEITTEEEALGDFIVPAYRRISTTIYIPPPTGRPGIGQIVEINPEELMVPVLKPASP